MTRALLALAMSALLFGCATATLVRVEGLKEPVPAVTLEVVGLTERNQRVVQRYTAKRLASAGTEVSAEAHNEAPVRQGGANSGR